MNVIITVRCAVKQRNVLKMSEEEHALVIIGTAYGVIYSIFINAVHNELCISECLTWHYRQHMILTILCLQKTVSPVYVR